MTSHPDEAEHAPDAPKCNGGRELLMMRILPKAPADMTDAEIKALAKEMAEALRAQLRAKGLGG